MTFFAAVFGMPCCISWLYSFFVSLQVILSVLRPNFMAHTSRAQSRPNPPAASNGFRHKRGHTEITQITATFNQPLNLIIQTRRNIHRIITLNRHHCFPHSFNGKVCLYSFPLLNSKSSKEENPSKYYKVKLMPEQIIQISKITSNRQVTIPAEIMKKLNLKPSDKILWIQQNNNITIKKA